MILFFVCLISELRINIENFVSLGPYSVSVAWLLRCFKHLFIFKYLLPAESLMNCFRYATDSPSSAFDLLRLINDEDDLSAAESAACKPQ